ncbi:RHS repeat-associated core domain-containing protein [Pseudomonas sp. PSE1(2024)]|uniref:RHS repeat-associated core domain-containing protein n=1 Tax=Pseudomonas sp. PSE1(2024) TaxID=3228746 RepID=UPI003D993BB7
MNASVHHRTPSLIVMDGRGLTVREVSCLRTTAGAPTESLITRNHYDSAGRLVECWDPRLFGSAPKPNLVTVHGLIGQVLKTESVDSGDRVILSGLADQVLTRWDGRGNVWNNVYDSRLRLLAVGVNDQPDIETLTYGQADADPGQNIRGQLIHKVDPSGSTDFGPFSLSGLPFAETQTLDGATYTTRWHYGADGKPLSQTDAGGHLQKSRYDVAGQLIQVTLQLAGSHSVQDILKGCRYNAEGLPEEQTLGNGVIRTWNYDDANGWLTSIKAGVPGQPLRQYLEYGYDNTGNVVSLQDHTFQPKFFANQRISGIRHFTYDSLYRLISATGHDALPATGTPGRPVPSDPAHHLNYRQTYSYDTGGNMTRMVHTRAVGGYTRQMFIQPSSNRGVQWQAGDPDPDFPALFDRHGNLQQLHPGQPLEWNLHDQLSSVTLIERSSEPDDKETYRYSGGRRVSKRHETHTPSTSHFQQVYYLHGLEIRTRETGEVLHVITLPNAIGNVRCLHWIAGRPAEVDNDQVRYCLDDIQHSGMIELDQQARLISQEDYYPFGGTAALTAGSAREVSYKTLRYSGEEMDETGLYAYGRRYYAWWCLRWISADPAGAVDGWNLYAMVRNNPVSAVDVLGLTGERLNQRVSGRTTAMITAGNTAAAGTPAQIKKRLAANPDSRFSKKFRSNVAVAHAGALIPGEGAEEDVILTDFINIPLTETLTSAEHGIHLSRPVDYTLGDDNLASLGVYQITDFGLFKDHMEKQYTNRLKDRNFAVKVYVGASTEPTSLAGMEYEVPAIHSQILERMELHIRASDMKLPASRGLPGAHAEVQAASAALYIQKTLFPYADLDPESISLVTQRLQNVEHAQAFEACFSCAGHLVATYDNAVKPFNVLTGSTGLTHEIWKNQLDALQ